MEKKRARPSNYDSSLEQFARRSGVAAKRIGLFVNIHLLGEPPLPSYDEAPAVGSYSGPMPELDKNVKALVQMSERGLESIK